MPVRTRSQTANTNVDVEEEVKVVVTEKTPVPRTKKIVPSQEEKRKERDEYKRRVYERRAKFIAENNYADSPVLELMRKAKRELTDDEFWSFYFYVSDLPMGGNQACWMSVPKDKNRAVALSWLHRFMKLVTEGMIWTKTWNETKNGKRYDNYVIRWTKMDDIVALHKNKIFLEYDDVEF